MTQIDHSPPALPSGSDADLEAVEGALPPIGRRRFIAGVGAAAGAAALATALPAGVAQAAVPPGACKFVPLPTPKRVADSRFPGKYNFSVVGPNHLRVPLAGLYGIPTNVSAVVGTVTNVNQEPSRGNVVSVFPTGGSVPEISNLNTRFWREMNANLASVKVENGGVDVWAESNADLIFDVIGYFVPVDSAVSDGRFIPLNTPARAYDSRSSQRGSKVNTGETIVVDVTQWVPADASAVVVNLTCVDTVAPAFYTVFPYTDVNVPETSSLNASEKDEMRAASVVCQVSDVDGRRRIKIFADHGGNLVVDVFGYFTGPSSAVSTDGLFVPSAPTRIFDSRRAGPSGRLWSRWIQEVEAPADAAANGSAIVANITMVQPYKFNLLTVLRARQNVPQVSNVNAMRPFMDVPNLALSRITTLPENGSKAAIQIYTDHPSHVVVDYAGYFTGSPAFATGPRPVNPPPGAAPLEWTIRFNKGISGSGSSVMPPTRDGDPVLTTDRGYVWHWEGTGMVGEAAHVAVFAHRTEANAPFHGIDRLGPGDTWTIDTADGRRYTYAFADRFLTDANTQNILNATRAVPGNTFSLVACTKGTGNNPFGPTSIRYRIIVTGVEVGWTAIREVGYIA